MADEDLKKAFQDLQFKTNETRSRIAQGEVNKKINMQKKKVSETTYKSLVDIPSETPFYRSIGRIFIMTDKDSELTRHQEEAKVFGEKIESINKQKDYLEKSLSEAESNLREMIQSRRN